MAVILLAAGAGLGLGTAAATEGSVTVGGTNVPSAIAAMLPQDSEEAGFQPMFGARATDGWAQCGPGGFELTEGVATSWGGMGLWWCTNRQVTNFVLRGEWRLTAADSDTGVFVRFPAPGPDPWNAVRQGHELEIGDDPSGHEPAWRTGALYPFSAPATVPTRPVGEWNRFELIAVGQTYVVRINGQTVNVWTDPERRSACGYIGLQNYAEGKSAQFRRLRVRDLP